MIFENLSPELATTLAIICLIEVSIGALIWWRLTKSNTITDKNPENEQSLSFLITLLAALFMLIFTVTISGFLAQTDRPFYAAGGTDNGEWTFSPAHYIIFLTCYPVYLMVGALLYALIKKNDVAALPRLRWFILVASIMPMMFIPAVNGELLDSKVTTWETIYLAAYQIANFAWILLGLIPIGLYAIKKMLSGLGDTAH